MLKIYYKNVKICPFYKDKEVEVGKGCIYCSYFKEKKADYVVCEFYEKDWKK